MSRFFNIFFSGLLLPALAFGQMGKPYSMTLNGVKVIVQPSGNELVEILTVFKGGVQNYTAEKAGVEALAMRALTECGTMKRDKNAFQDALDAVSAEMGGSAGMDFSSFRMNCIRGDFETVWPLYVEAMTVPKFNPEDFARIREEALTGLKADESNPDVAIDNMARGLAFAGRNYAKNPSGTLKSVGALTVTDIRNHYRKLLNRGRMVMVVVADIDSADLRARIAAFLGGVPAGAPFVAKKETYTPPANTLKPEKKDLATNYLQGIASAPLPGTPDYNAFMLAMRIFSSKHFVEVRSNNGLSYAPGAWFSGGLTPYANIYVTTTEPNKYAAVARQLIEKVKRTGFSQAELKNEKTALTTETYYRQETAAEQARVLAVNEVVHGDWRRAMTLKEDLKKVTTADLNRVFGKYMNRITWAYQGDPAKVDAKMFTQATAPAVPAEKKAF